MGFLSKIEWNGTKLGGQTMINFTLQSNNAVSVIRLTAAGLACRGRGIARLFSGAKFGRCHQPDYRLGALFNLPGV
jgi:hypothetical protein